MFHVVSGWELSLRKERKKNRVKKEAVCSLNGEKKNNMYLPGSMGVPT